MTPPGTKDRSTECKSRLAEQATTIHNTKSVLLCNLVSNDNALIPTNDDLSTIRDTTDALEHLTATHMKLLDARAASYAKLANFKSAIQDTMEMIKLAPQSALGYLRAGDLLAIRGKQASAIRTYDHALGSVSPADPQYSHLQKCREQAQKVLDTKIDLISMLPLEILHYIISFLRLDTAAVCSTVCKLWQRRFVECGTDLWRNPHISLRRTRFPALCHTSPSVATQVQSLTITNVYTYRSMIRLAAIKNFMNIRSLRLTDITLDGKVGEYIMAILHTVRDTLTDLALESPSKNFTLPVGLVLTECNNLTSLKYVFQVSNPFEYGDDSSAITPITSLYLDAYYMTSEDLSKILQRCPKLRDLAIFSNALSFLPVIRSHCPNLQRLVTSRNYHDQKTSYTCLNSLSASEGLHTLSVRADYKLKEDAIHISSLFAEHKNSLGYLDICLPSMNIEACDISDGQTLTMPTPYATCNLHFSQLRVFHCRFGGRHESVPAAIIRQCPSLQDVDLGYYERGQLRYHKNMPINGIPDALKTLNNLQELSLQRFGNEDLESPSLSGLFHLHSSLGKKSSLHIVKISGSGHINELLLQSFAALTNLKTLELDCDDISDGGFLDFARRRSTMKLPLKTLKVFPGYRLSDSMIEALKVFEGLQHLTISSRELINEELMQEFTATSKTLRTLNFHDTRCTHSFLKQIRRNGVQVQTFNEGKATYRWNVCNQKHVVEPKPISWSFVLD